MAITDYGNQSSSLRQGNGPRPGPKRLALLRDVLVRFGHLTALHSVDFEIIKKDFLFITGASGAGKTTLLNLISGDILPQQGQIELDPTIFTSRIFQDLKLYPNRTIEQNLFLSFDKSVYESKNEFYTELSELTKFLGIHDRLSLKIGHANGGLKQLVSVVRSLLSKPQLLLADEPTCSLDKELASRIYDLMRFYNEKFDTTIVWASHNRELVKRFSGRNIHLDRGKIVYSGHACFI